MKIDTKLLAAAVGLSVAVSLLAMTPSHASSGGTLTPDIPPLPDTMTVEQMDAISEGAVELAFPSEPTDDPGISTFTVPTGVAGSRCYLTPGDMWVRASGRGYRYGTVGSKPRLHSCSLDVRQTGMASEVWQFNGWIWFRAAGPFNSYGSGNMQQKSVQHVCTGKGKYPYKVITTAWGTNGKGQTGVGRDATAEFKFNCG